jgi:hypothetical protein
MIMSIHLYDAGTSSLSWTGFSSWFETNKNGLMTNISLRVSGDTSNLCYFKDNNDPDTNNSIIYIILRDGSSGVIYIQGLIGYFGQVSYGNGGCMLRRAIMCSNGILFEFATSETTSAGICDVGIVFDKNDDPVIMFRRGMSSGTYRTPMASRDWGIYGTSTASLSPTVTILPKYGSKRTTLAPVIPEGIETENYCPNCWVASCTQLSSEGLNAVRINAVDYITNGCIYVRDIPTE